MKNNAKKKAKEFIKKYKFTKPTVEGICDIIQKQGYSIIEFNSFDNTPDVNNIIKSFSLTDYIMKTRAFTFTNENFRLVFVNEDLADEEKLLVLLHEEGHIFCDHFSKRDIFGEDVKDEEEANDFAHYILKPSLSIKLFKHKKALICALIGLLVLTIGVFAVNFAIKESSYYGNYYIARTGHSYHLKDCGYVQNKTDSHRMTKKEYNTGEFLPCERCIGE